MGAVLAAALGGQGCAQLPSGTPVVVECHAAAAAQPRTGPALVGRSYGMAMTPISLDAVQFGSDAAVRSAAVQNLYTSRSPTDSVRVTARFVSCSDAPVLLYVRTSFLQADTAPAEAPTAWKRVFIAPRATAVYSETSVSTDVASYLIEVQR